MGLFKRYVTPEGGREGGLIMLLRTVTEIWGKGNGS